jgi:hypothetical protein
MSPVMPPPNFPPVTFTFDVSLPVFQADKAVRHIEEREAITEVIRALNNFAYAECGE